MKGRLTPEQQAKVDEAMGKKPGPSSTSGKKTAPKQKTAARQVHAGADIFSAANAVPVEDVADWLALMHGGHPVCPGCGTTGDSSVRLVGGGLKCMHNRCAEKGVPGKPGFRTNVDLVVDVKGVTPLEAAKLIAQQFGLDVDTGAASSEAFEASSAGGAEPWLAPVGFGADGPPPPFPTYIFPSWLKAWVLAVAVMTQTPADLAAMLVLSVLSLSLAKKVRVRVRDQWEEPVNSYSAVVMESGTNKSTLMSKATRPVHQYECEVTAQAEAANAVNKIKGDILERQLKRAIDAAASAGPKTSGSGPASTGAPAASTPEQLAEQLRQAKPVALPLLMVADITPEKLGVVLQEQDERTAVMSSEGGIFGMLQGRYNDHPDLDLFLKSYTEDDHKVLRIGRDPVFLKAPNLTIGLTVQPHVIEGLGRDQSLRGRGLLARFWYSLPEDLVGSRQVDPPPPPVPAAVVESYEAGINVMLRYPRQRVDAAGNPVGPTILTFSPKAERRFVQFAASIERRLAAAGDLRHIRDWANRLPGSIARIAGLLHMAQQVYNPNIDTWATVIADDTMAVATAAGSYLLLHALAAFEMMQASEEHNDAKYVLTRIGAAKDFSVRDLFQKTKSHFGSVDKLKAALAVLEERGFVRRVARTQGAVGRPSEKYEVNPAWAPAQPQKPQNPSAATSTPRAPAPTPSTPTASSATQHPPSPAPEPTPTAAQQPTVTPALVGTPVATGRPADPRRARQRQEQRQFEEENDQLLEQHMAVLGQEFEQEQQAERATSDDVDGEAPAENGDHNMATAKGRGRPS